MSEDELKAIEELWRQEPKTGWPDLLVDVVPELVAEVRRLRLVASAASCIINEGWVELEDIERKAGVDVAEALRKECE